jgi:hypothetical protein
MAIRIIEKIVNHVIKRGKSTIKFEKIAPTDKILKNKKIIPEKIKQNLKLILSLFLNHLMKIYIKEKIDKRPIIRNDPKV